MPSDVSPPLGRGSRASGAVARWWRTLRDALRDAARFAPVRPALWAGVRAAIATVLPLALASYAREPLLAWTGLAGFLASLVDKGGAYRTRAAAMASLTVGGAALCAVAAVAGKSTVGAIALTLVSATALTLLRVYGGGASSVGSSILVLFLVSLARPVDAFPLAFARAAAVSLGGAWAMVLALIFWPVRLYRPARLSVAASLRALAALALEASRLPVSANDATSAALRAQRPIVRTAIEEARAILAATRRGRRGDSGRGERLLVVLESANQVFGSLVTLAELLETVQRRGAWPAAQGAVMRALSDAGRVLERIARAVERESQSKPIDVEAWDLDALAAPPSLRGIDASSIRDATQAEYALASQLLAGIRGRLEDAADAATTLEDERASIAIPVQRPSLEPGHPITGPLLPHLTMRSDVLRHALRAGVTTAAAAWVAHAFSLERGYWVTISAAVILQPQIPATFLKAMQRLAGTLLGGIIAATIAATVHDPRGMMAVVFVLAVVSVAVLPINYGLYSVFLTPTFILVAETSGHLSGLVKLRIVNTLLGAALAFVASRVLWPISERQLFPNAAASALRAARAYFHDALTKATYDTARRDAGIALLNAESSLQRWMAEARHRAPDLESPMALLVYTRHFAAAVSALASALATAPPMDLAPFMRDVEAALDALARAIAEGHAPPPLPVLADAIAHAMASIGPDARAPERRARALLRTRLERVAEPLAVQHAAVTRWLASASRQDDDVRTL